MLQLHGTLAGIDSETVTPPSGESFVSHTARVVSGEGRTSYVRLTRDFPHAMLPEPGEPVVLLVWPRPYVKKATNDLACGYTAYGTVRQPQPAQV